MSYQASNAVCNFSRATSSGEMLVLMVLANHAGMNGGNAFPSIKQIAEQARLTTRQVQRNLRSAAARGEIVIHEGGGPGKRNKFCFSLPGLDPKIDCEECAENVQSIAPLDGQGGGDAHVRGGVSPMSGGG